MIMIMTVIDTAIYTSFVQPHATGAVVEQRLGKRNGTLFSFIATPSLGFRVPLWLQVSYQCGTLHQVSLILCDNA